MPHLARRRDGEHLAFRGHEIVRVARVPGLGKAGVQRGLQHGGWIVGTQLKPGAEPGVLIVRSVIGELDAEMSSTGKAAHPPAASHQSRPSSGALTPGI